MRQPLRITHVFGNAYAGDWAFYPLKFWKEGGHHVTAICPTDGPLVGRLRQEGIEVYIVPFPRRLRHLGDGWRCLRQFALVFRELHSDIAHFHLVPANLWGRIGAWLARVPVRITQWPGPLPLELPISLYLELATVWMDQAIIASCISTQRIYEQYWHTRHKIHLIYYGFPLSRFLSRVDGKAVRHEFGIGLDAPVVAMAAYMYPPLREKRFRGIGIKGHEILIQAAREVSLINPDVRFLIVGDELIPRTAGTYKTKLVNMVRELGLEKTVIFAGYRPDVPSILAGADVIAVPSISENVGGAVEPLLMGKPVIASNVGGLPDVVIDNETGYLVSPGDHHALAQAIIRMLALSPEQRQQMGKRGQVIVANLFDINKTARQQESLYYQLLTKQD